MTSFEGRRIGRFYIKREIARGRSGVVYSAWDKTPLPGAPREAAVKVIERAALGRCARERFYREAVALKRLQHPNAVHFREAGLIRGGAYLGMDFIEGSTLSDLMAPGPMAVTEVVRVGLALTAALRAAHAAGIVHRDVKPANVRIEVGTGRVVLVDFGLAALADASSLTATHATVGTPAYMAPEQADPGGGFGTVGPPSDIWALGCILYEMLAGARPFAGETPIEAIRAALEEEPALLRLRRPETPPGLERIVRRCLAKRVSDRYPDAAALEADLQRTREGRHVRARWSPRPIARLMASTERHPGRALAITAALSALLSAAITLALVRRFAAGAGEVGTRTAHGARHSGS